MLFCVNRHLRCLTLPELLGYPSLFPDLLQQLERPAVRLTTLCLLYFKLTMKVLQYKHTLYSNDIIQEIKYTQLHQISVQGLNTITH